MNKYLKHYGVLLLIVALAVIFRFVGIDWDQGQHLHPDERFLTMVGNAMRIPTDFSTYLDPATSKMNPANIGFSFYVYGTFPVVINKLLSVLLHADSYNGFTIQGRALSAFADIVTLFFLYRIALLMEKYLHIPPLTKYAVALFYAIAVFPIQLSHFFAVDTFVTTFLVGAIYFALRFSFSGSYFSALAAALFFGFAVSSKVNGIFMLPVIGLFFIQGLLKPFYDKHHKLSFRHASTKTLLKPIFVFFLFIIVSYITIRICSPYLFENKSFLNPSISKLFLQNAATLKTWEGKDTWFPPAIQWISKPPVIFNLVNVAVFGVGLPYFFFVLAGIFYSIARIKKFHVYILLIWTAAIFFYQSVQFVKTMRYLIIIYPFLALFAGIGFVYLTKKWHSGIRIGALALVFFWPLSFLSIYLHPHSRITASAWMHQQLPNGSRIATEHWDDWIPISLPDIPNKQFSGEQLPVFDADTPEKWQRMEQILSTSNYYVLSSNRGWGSISTVPEKYPQMSKFYEELLAGKRDFKKIAEFTSYPSLRYLGIPITINDDWSDEAFTVYDHPKVMLFQRITEEK